MSSPPRKKSKVYFSSSSSDEDNFNDFNAETSNILKEYGECQNLIDEFNSKTTTEIDKIQKKYDNLRKTWYDQRDVAIQKVPYFWVMAMVNHPQTFLEIDDEEENCLHFMTKLEVEDFEKYKGYQIKFYFKENPYFENDILVKKFQMDRGDPKSSSTLIKWKEDKDLTNIKIDKSNMTTFFNWFVMNDNPTDDHIAEIIHDDLWPNPLKFFLIPHVQEEYDDDADDEGENSSEEEGNIDDPNLPKFDENKADDDDTV